MVKLVSFLVFTASFIWSWWLFHSKTDVGINVHAGIQSKLAVIIENAIQKARPNAYNFQIITLYTKNLEDNKISAYFTYRYSEKMEDRENTDQTVKGEAILNRAASEVPDEQKWVIQSVKADDTTIEFRDGSVIKSDGSVPAEEGTESGAPTDKQDHKNAPATSTDEEKKTE